jgi:mannose-6-phosphate isomerase-like protein (cupin superfamily)
MIVRSRQNAPHYVWGRHCDGWRLVDRADLSVVEERMPPGTAEGRHYHSRSRQLFFILAGRLVVEAGTEVRTLDAGESVEMAPGLVHLVKNPFSAEALFLLVSAPSAAGDRIDLP